MSRVAKKRQAGVAKACQIYRTMPSAGTTLVLAHCHITHPVQSILDAPVAAIQIQKMLRIGSIGSQAGDRVRNFRYPFVAGDSRSLDANRLGKPWPVKKATESAAGLKMANLNSPMPFVDIANLVKLLTAKTFAVGWKGRD
ncbi:hypothetical protein CA13_65740 [Planctomycetes bacterium CA13]|uniref:Uncharacterized protein n=1 Tax=Novipirellula herctigrandis TaxID=2527986 RepID=A0A5C5ZCP3_9BACT|nr:hypothetical protein CA13_65740 [Planctomycetes bacterium CA13]